MKLRLSRRALDDLQVFYRQGLHQFGEQQAVSYQRALHEVFRLIAEFPEANRVRTEFTRAYRIQRHKAHLIFYRVENGAVYVTRIRHGHEDWSTD